MENTLEYMAARGAGVEHVLAADGYELLAAVLQRAFNQAAHGKGKERHAQHGERFEDQMMQDMARRFGVGALLSQAFKKSEESQRLPPGRDTNELLGAIVYLAGAVIALERSRGEASTSAPKASNDNTPSCCRDGDYRAGQCVNCPAKRRA